MKMNKKFEVKNAQGGGWVVVFGDHVCAGLFITHFDAVSYATRRTEMRNKALGVA